jgi:hypothetical protein
MSKIFNFFSEVAMKITFLFLTTLLSLTVHAQDRIVKCAAVDGLDREYSFEMNVDSGVIKTMTTDGFWKVLFSDEKKCGMNIGKAVCSQTMRRNLDKPNQSHFAIVFSNICKSKGGGYLKELNGVAEINRFGDSHGTFVCGSLPSNELQLSNCMIH